MLRMPGSTGGLRIVTFKFGAKSQYFRRYKDIPRHSLCGSAVCDPPPQLHFIFLSLTLQLPLSILSPPFFPFCFYTLPHQSNHGKPNVNLRGQ